MSTKIQKSSSYSRPFYSAEGKLSWSGEDTSSLLLLEADMVLEMW